MQIHYTSTTSKSKGKKKFKSAEDARKSRELEKSWKDLQKKWEVDTTNKKASRALSAETLQYNLSQSSTRSTQKIPSLGSGIGVATKSEPKVYTGTLIKGISQMHKSNMVPVIDEQQIVDIARMRR